jgi:hypothetical protein
MPGHRTMVSLNHFTQSIPAPTTPKPGAAGTPTPRNTHLLRGGEGLWPFTPPHSWSENSIPIMIRVLRGRLCRRRAQAQFQRILRDADPRLRAGRRPWPHASSEPPTVLARTKPTQGRNSPTMFRTLNTTRATTGRRTLASILATTARDTDQPATSTPAGATGTVVARNHHPTLATEYHVLEFNPEGADFPANSTRTIDTSIFGAGASNPSSFGAVRSRSGPTVNTMPSRTEFARDRDGLVGQP